MKLNEAIQIMTNEIVSILHDNKPTIYLFGSVALDEAKAVTDYVCGDCDNDGMAKWLEENVL